MRCKFGNGANIDASYSEAADGLYAATLCATLACVMTGNASEFIPRTMASIVDCGFMEGQLIDDEVGVTLTRSIGRDEASLSAEVTRTAAAWVARLKSFGPLGKKHLVESLWRQIARSD